MQNESNTGFTSGNTATGSDRETTVGDFGSSTTGTGESRNKKEEIKSKAREAASEAGHRVADKVEHRIEERKGQATHQLHDLARSLRTASDQLPSDNGMSRYMGMAATQVDNLASFFDNREVAELVDEVEHFARQQPAVFVSGAFAVGMLGARFLKSSRRNLIDEGVREGWDTREMTGRIRDPEEDAISRPGAPGYAPPSDRGETGML